MTNASSDGVHVSEHCAFIDKTLYLYCSHPDVINFLLRNNVETLRILGGGGDITVAWEICRIVVAKNINVIVHQAFSAGVYYCLLTNATFLAGCPIGQHMAGRDKFDKVSALQNMKCILEDLKGIGPSIGMSFLAITHYEGDVLELMNQVEKFDGQPNTWWIRCSHLVSFLKKVGKYQES